MDNTLVEQMSDTNSIGHELREEPKIVGILVDTQTLLFKKWLQGALIIARPDMVLGTRKIVNSFYPKEFQEPCKPESCIGNGNDGSPIVSKHPSELADRRHVIVEMLEDLATEHESEGPSFEGQRRRPTHHAERLGAIWWRGHLLLILSQVGGVKVQTNCGLVAKYLGGGIAGSTPDIECQPLTINPHQLAKNRNLVPSGNIIGGNAGDIDGRMRMPRTTYQLGQISVPPGKFPDERKVTSPHRLQAPLLDNELSRPSHNRRR